MLYSLVAHDLTGIVIEEFSETWIIKSNTIYNRSYFVSWINLPTDVRIERLRTESIIHKAAPVERFGTVYLFVGFFEFPDNLFVASPFLIVKACEATFVS